MITTSKNIIPATTNPFLEAKNNLKKIASNNYTKSSVSLEQEPVIQQEDQQERTLALLSCTDNLDDIIEHIKKEGFTVIQTKVIQYSEEQAQAFYADHVTQNYYDKMVRWLSSGSNVCALVLEKENAVTDWRLLMGPTTYKKARKSYPNSIRALFGKDASQNATHGSDSDVSSKKEIDFIFGHSSLVADAANLPHVKYDGMNSATVEHDIMEKSNTLPDTEGLVTIDLHSTSITDTTGCKTPLPVAVSQTEESDVTEQKPLLAADAKEASPIDEKEGATVAEIIPVTPMCTVTGIVGETPVLTADDKQEDKAVDMTPTVLSATVIEGELKSKDVASATINNDLKVKETIPVSVSNNSTTEDSVTTDKDIKTDTIASVTILEDASAKEITPAITTTTANNDLKKQEIASVTTDSDLKKEEDVQAVIKEVVVNKEEPVSVDNNLKNEEKISTVIENPLKDKENKSVTVDISLKGEEIELTFIEVTETKNTPREPVDTTAIVNDSPRDCITMTPTVSTKDEEVPTLARINTENKVQEAMVEEEKSIVNDKPDLSTNVNDTDITPMTPPAEINNASNVSSSFTLESKAPKKDSKTPSLRSNSTEKKSPLARKTSVKSEVKSETVIPSSSRIRPPSIKRGQNGTMVRSGEPIGRSRISNNKIDSANSSAGTTRIARLSPSATVKNEQVSTAEKKKPAIAREAVKKPSTKVSKNLPRVATIVSQKTIVKEEVNEAEKKPKKRGSSTKSFITRLTAPTVASQNKKADSEPGIPVSRRATVPAKRSSAVGPASSASKEITTRNKQ